LYLWIRHASLSATYELEGNRLDHVAYMRALLGPAGKNAFPTYNDYASAAFDARAADIQSYASEFAAGSGAGSLRCWMATHAASDRSGFKQLGDAARQLGAH
jgi:hypothetical protein